MNRNSKTTAKAGQQRKEKRGNETWILGVRWGGSLFLLAGATFFPFLSGIKFVMLLLAYLLVGSPILWKAGINFLHGKFFDENFLMAVATIGAFGIGQYPESIAVMLFYQVGEFLQEKAIHVSRNSIYELLDLRSDHANLWQNGVLSIVNPKTVQIGETIVVKPGEKVPLDGIVLEGNGWIDTSALTGESLLQSVKEGDEILSGFVNQTSMLYVKVLRVFHESTVGKILQLVQQQTNRKTTTEKFITKFSQVYTPLIVIFALFIAFIPPLLLPGQTFSEWIYRGLIFLVISCPCALVISIPLGFFGGIGIASKKGILVKGSQFLEALTQVKYVVFDKTGTLTQGVFRVKNIRSVSSFTEEEILHRAAQLESGSNHPIALSIQQAYGKSLVKTKMRNHQEIPGQGIQATLNGQKVAVGNLKFIGSISEVDGETWEGEIQAEPEDTLVFVAIEQKLAGYILIADQVKKDAKIAITGLRALGIEKIFLFTGDAQPVADAIGRQLGIDEVYSELLPMDKVAQLEKVIKHKGQNEKIAFIGDGINDTPALARADIGISMGKLASDAAIEIADIVLMTDQPSRLVTSIELAHFTKSIVWQNIILALGIKIVMLLLGTFGLATMWEAVFADVGVTILAVLNTLRILRRS